MKPTPTDLPPLLAFGAHPDDIDFGCGEVIAVEVAAGRPVHLVVCSLGEAATHGKPDQRKADAEASAAILGASVEFIDLGGDAHFQVAVAHAIKLARILRRVRPGVVLAPSPCPNQHPDHAALGQLVRDAARLARFGGVAELRSALSHAIDLLFFYAVTPLAEPRDVSPVFVNVSSVLPSWQRAMEAHVSQTTARKYVDLVIAQARVRGLSAGVEYAIALFPNDPLVLDGLSQVRRSARHF